MSRRKRFMTMSKPQMAPPLPPFSLAVLRIDTLLPVSSRLWSLIRSPLTGSRMLWQLALSQAPRRKTNSIISPFFVPPLFFAGDFFFSSLAFLAAV